jgi:hypothetical protein
VNPDESLATYLPLADFAEKERTASGFSLRDQYLVLAVDSAASANRLEMASTLWQRLATSSPGHPFTRFRDCSEALRSPESQTMLRALRLEYPPGLARDQLQRLRSAVPASTPVVRPFKPPETVAQAMVPPAFSGFGQPVPPEKKPLEPLPWRQSAATGDQVSAFNWWYCAVLAWLVLFLGLAWIAYPFWR